MLFLTPRENMRAVLANEPRAYRDVLADALWHLRPGMEVSAVDPDALRAEVERVRPHLVVSDAECDLFRSGVLTWIRLYPGGENLAEVTTAGGRATIVGIGLEDLLSVIDGTELLRGAAEETRVS